MAAIDDILANSQDRNELFDRLRKALDRPAVPNFTSEMACKIVTEVAELRAMGVAMRVRCDSILADLSNLPGFEEFPLARDDWAPAAVPASEQPGEKVPAAANDVRPAWGFMMQDAPGTSIEVPGGERFRQRLALHRRIEEGSPNYQTATDHRLADISRQLDAKTASYVRQQFGSKRVTSKGIEACMDRCLGMFQSASSMATALGRHLNRKPPRDRQVRWARNYADVIHIGKNRYVVFCWPNGRGMVRPDISAALRARHQQKAEQANPPAPPEQAKAG